MGCTCTWTPGHRTIDKKLELDPTLAVEDMWMRRPDVSGEQFTVSPAAPTSGDIRWLTRNRQEGDDPWMPRLPKPKAFGWWAHPTG